MRIVMADSDLFQVFNAKLVSVYIQSYVSEVGIGWKHLYNIGNLAFTFLLFIFLFGCF